MSKKPRPLPELHLHHEWLKRLDSAKVVYRTWGSAGPDILIEGSAAILEVKKAESAYFVKEAFLEIFAREGHADFCPKTAPFVGVITPEKVRIWRNTPTGFGPVDCPDIVFVTGEEKQVVDFIREKNTGHRLPLDTNLNSVLQLIYSKNCPDSVAALLVVLNLHKKPVVAANGAFIFAPGTKDERVVPVSEISREFLLAEVINKYEVRDPEIVKSHIRHKWSQYQPDGKKAALGKYYTPEHLVAAVQQLLAPVLKSYPDGFVADLAAGCGAFMAAFEDYRVMGRDIDEQAVLVLREMGFANVSCGNSLHNVSRGNLGLTENDNLIIVGNPPYNDTSSLNKRYSTGKKDALSLDIDDDIKSKDLGISFLRAFAKLAPAAMCVIHPLSYLTKEANFKNLKEFTEEYTLKNAVVFSSAEFGANIGAKTPFPVVAALYAPGSMRYEDIREFAFPIYESGLVPFCDGGLRLVLSKVRTIDGIIRKYPPTKSMCKESDIGIYNYNIRDTNSLLTSGALTTKNSDDSIPVQFDEFWKYAYLNCLKRYFGQSFIFGNISPLINMADVSEQWFADALVFDTIMNNQNLWPLNRENSASIVLSRFLLNDARRRAKTFNVAGVPNFYESFVSFWEYGAPAKQVLAEWLKKYFANLRNSSLTREG